MLFMFRELCASRPGLMDRPVRDNGFGFVTTDLVSESKRSHTSESSESKKEVSPGAHSAEMDFAMVSSSTSVWKIVTKKKGKKGKLEN